MDCFYHIEISWISDIADRRITSPLAAPGKFQTPPDLVVDHWTSDVESSSPLDFLLLHAMWTPCGCLMSYEIMSIISVACDFTTKSGGIWTVLLCWAWRTARWGELFASAQGAHRA